MAKKKDSLRDRLEQLYDEAQNRTSAMCDFEESVDAAIAYMDDMEEEPTRFTKAEYNRMADELAALVEKCREMAQTAPAKRRKKRPMKKKGGYTLPYARRFGPR